MIKLALVEQFGEKEAGWWRQGVPEPLRKKCRERQEGDPEPIEDPYCYTDLLDLRDILEKRWTSIQGHIGVLGSDKPRALREIERLNGIRKSVMHPVRGAPPDEQAFVFVREVRERLQIGS